jgi:hypothetical protein
LAQQEVSTFEAHFSPITGKKMNFELPDLWMLPCFGDWIPFKSGIERNATHYYSELHHSLKNREGHAESSPLLFGSVWTFPH